MSSVRNSLKNEAKNYINIKELFPRSNIDLRKEPTEYQARKIREALNSVKKISGGYTADLVPMGRGRKKYLADHNLPPYMKGIFLSGGAKVNSGLHYVAGEVRYKRGGADRARSELYTHGDVDELIESGKDILKNRKSRRTSITANGRVIGSAQNMRDNQTILKEAAHIFLKYSEMADAGKNRTRKFASGEQFTCAAAHPSEWGMGILFEAANKPIKAKGKKNAKAKRK